MAGKIILDEIEKSSTGTGIKLNSPLLSNTGVQIISESGTLGSTITFPSTIDNTTLGSGVNFNNISINSISGDKLNLSVSSFAENTMQYYEIGNIRYAYGYVTSPSTSTYVNNYGTTYYNYTPFTYVTNYNSVPLVIGPHIQNINYEDAGTITTPNLPADEGGGTYSFRFLMRTRSRSAAIHSVKVAFIVVGEKYVG